MRYTFRLIAISAVCVGLPICVRLAAAQRFAVVSVKPSIPAPGSASGIRTAHGRLDASNVTLQRCIMGAYGVGPNQISGGPDWLDSEFFEITATADQPTDDDAAMMTMLKSVLAERFKLVLHSTTRTTSALVLDVAKTGPKLVKSDPGEAATNTSTSNTGAVVIDAHHADMDAFARVLSRKTEYPVVNNTGLEGIFDFKLQWMPERMRPADAATPEAPSIFSAIQEQLGLQLRSRKTEVEMLVIDHAERPSAN